jgi:predicted ATP-dependent protease
MARPKPLPLSKLYNRCSVGQFKFKSTDDLKDLAVPLGQQRAMAAIEFGIDMPRKGYNLYAMGPSGSGKHTIVRRFLDAKARKSDGANVFDWCYVNNFEESRQPRILRMPVGTARKFAEKMDRLVDDLRVAIPAMYESNEYRAQLGEIEEDFSAKEERPLEKLRAAARKKNIAVVRTQAGLAMSPMKDGEILPPDVYEKLSVAEKKAITDAVADVQKQLQAIALETPKWRRDFQQQVRDLSREICRMLAHTLIEEIRKGYEALEDVQAYLSEVEEDIVSNAETFRRPHEGEAPPQATDSAEDVMSAYRVNVLIDNRKTKGAPVIYEDNPTYENLIGAIEHIADMGALLTDFTLIKPGALHRANGGYLILDAAELAGNPYAWDGIKRALQAGVIRTEPLGKHLSMMNTVTIEPQSVPLNVKIILLGVRRLFYSFQRHDSDFDELFKVSVDFEEEIERSDKNVQLYARMIATTGRREGLLPFDKKGVARIVEFSSRQVDHSEKLSVHMININDLMREADFVTRKAGKKIISSADIDTAIEAQHYRASRIPESMRESISSGTILLDIKGEKVGQINALSVYQMGNHSFGQPNRITARVRKGHGHVVDIEREVKLGGTLHTKGVLILQSYLSATYLPLEPLSLTASLAFEQNYGGVDGDSASSTELYALLSAISEVPIKQCFAVTGSVNQFGEVQAIGGVNEKIEGYFDVCKAGKLTGDQAVLIPASNVRNLMLKAEVLDAVKAGKFAIYPITTIDEGIEILTGVHVGTRGKNGKFPANTINGKVEARLRQFSKSKDDKDDDDS